MASKTIPDLPELATPDLDNTYFPVDNGTQTFKVKLGALYKNPVLYSPTFTVDLNGVPAASTNHLCYAEIIHLQNELGDDVYLMDIILDFNIASSTRTSATVHIDGVEFPFRQAALAAKTTGSTVEPYTAMAEEGDDSITVFHPSTTLVLGYSFSGRFVLTAKPAWADAALFRLGDGFRAAGDILRADLDPATPGWVLINDGAGLVSEEQYLATVRGGLGLNAASSNGYVLFTSGNASFVTSIPGTSLSGGIAASKIGNGDVDNPKLSFLNSITSNVQTQLDARLSKAGGTMAGDLILNADPTLALGAATRQYVDAVAAGNKWKDAVRVATTANITLSGAQTIDGVSVVATDRVLVKNQSTPANNGIYVASAGAWTRATDADAFVELNAASVMVLLGTVNANKGFQQTSVLTSLSDAQTWSQSFGAGTYVADESTITLSGQTFSLKNNGVDLAGAKVTGVLAIAKGGTGQTTATAAFAALAPSQAGNAGKAIVTDGTNYSLQNVAGGLLTDQVVTLPTTMVGNTSYQIALTATTASTLPIPTGSMVVETVDVSGNCSDTVQIQVSPNTGYTIRWKAGNITAGNAIGIRRPYGKLKFSIESGSTVWDVEYSTSSVIAPASNLPGSVSYEGSGSFSCFLKLPAGGDLAVGTARWSRVGPMVSLTLPNIEAATTATSLTISDSSLTGINTLPAAIKPTQTQQPIVITREGTVFQSALTQITSAGVFNIYKDGAGNGWSAASSVKGIGTILTIHYSVN